MIEDRSRDYMNARRVAKVRQESMAVKPGGAIEAKLIHNGWLNCCPPGIRDRHEGSGQERPLGTSTELPAGGAAGGNVEEVHPVGEKQPTAHRRPDPHHQERSVSGWGHQRGGHQQGDHQQGVCWLWTKAQLAFVSLTGYLAGSH